MKEGCWNEIKSSFKQTYDRLSTGGKGKHTHLLTHKHPHQDKQI